jgi:hypothetical protein
LLKNDLELLEAKGLNTAESIALLHKLLVSINNQNTPKSTMLTTKSIILQNSLSSDIRDNVNKAIVLFSNATETVLPTINYLLSMPAANINKILNIINEGNFRPVNYAILNDFFKENKVRNLSSQETYKALSALNVLVPLIGKKDSVIKETINIIATHATEGSEATVLWNFHKALDFSKALKLDKLKFLQDPENPKTINKDIYSLALIAKNIDKITTQQEFNSKKKVLLYAIFKSRVSGQNRHINFTKAGIGNVNTLVQDISEKSFNIDTFKIKYPEFFNEPQKK